MSWKLLIGLVSGLLICIVLWLLVKRSEQRHHKRRLEQIERRLERSQRPGNS